MWCFFEFKFTSTAIFKFWFDIALNDEKLSYKINVNCCKCSRMLELGSSICFFFDSSCFPIWFDRLKCCNCFRLLISVYSYFVRWLCFNIMCNEKLRLWVVSASTDKYCSWFLTNVFSKCDKTEPTRLYIDILLWVWNNSNFIVTNLFHQKLFDYNSQSTWLFKFVIRERRLQYSICIPLQFSWFWNINC